MELYINLTGLKISTHLRVVTKLEVPFIYAETVDSADQCEVELKKIPCPMPNKTGAYVCVHRHNMTEVFEENPLDQQSSKNPYFRSCHYELLLWLRY